MCGVSTVMEAETKHPAARRRDARGTAILVVADLWTLLHVYVGQRLLAQTSLAPAWRVLGWAGILLLVLAPFVALGAGRTERLPAKRGLEVAGFTAMGLSSLLIVFALAGDVLHVRAWLGVGGSQLAVVGGAMAVLVIGLWRARRPAAAGAAGSCSPGSRTSPAAASGRMPPSRRQRSRGRRRATCACCWPISRRARSRRAPPDTTCSSRGTRAAANTSRSTCWCGCSNR